MIKKFNQYIKESQNSNTLIIIDVQKSFRKFFTEMYLNELNKYCNQFKDVYQIWDNHVDGHNVDKDYLYDHQPDIPVHKDLYTFPNQRDIIEKRYNYNVNVDFYKKILDKNVYNDIKTKEKNKQLKKGDIFLTKEGTAIVYIGNNHKWHHLGKKLFNLLRSLKGKNVEIVGGSDSECLEDIFVSATSIGVNVKRNWKFIWSANHCTIQ